MRFFFFLLISITLYSEPLVFGVVPQQSTRELARDWKPLIDYLQKKTGETIVFKTEHSIPEFEKVLNEGGYDIAYMSPYHYVLAHASQGYSANVRDQKNLVGILVVRKDSGISDVRQMKGKQFLFPSPAAFAATLINKYELMHDYGINVDADQRFRYVNSHDSVYKGVARGIGDVGGGIERTYNDLDDPDAKEALMIIHKTGPFPSHPFACHPRISKKRQDMMTKALLEAPDGLLKPLQMKRLVEINDSEYGSVRAMMKILPKLEK